MYDRATWSDSSRKDTCKSWIEDMLFFDSCHLMHEKMEFVGAGRVARDGPMTRRTRLSQKREHAWLSVRGSGVIWFTRKKTTRCARRMPRRGVMDPLNFRAWPPRRVATSATLKLGCRTNAGVGRCTRHRTSGRGDETRRRADTGSWSRGGRAGWALGAGRWAMDTASSGQGDDWWKKSWIPRQARASGLPIFHSIHVTCQVN